MIVVGEVTNVDLDKERNKQKPRHWQRRYEGEIRCRSVEREGWREQYGKGESGGRLPFMLARHSSHIW